MKTKAVIKYGMIIDPDLIYTCVGTTGFARSNKIVENFKGYTTITGNGSEKEIGVMNKNYFKKNILSILPFKQPERLINFNKTGKTYLPVSINQDLLFNILSFNQRTTRSHSPTGILPITLKKLKEMNPEDYSIDEISKEPLINEFFSNVLLSSLEENPSIQLHSLDDLVRGLRI